MPRLVVNAPNFRQVVDCGGWRGTGLTPLFLRTRETIAKAVCALTPHPPQSKTLARPTHAFLNAWRLGLAPGGSSDFSLPLLILFKLLHQRAQLGAGFTF